MGFATMNMTHTDLQNKSNFKEPNVRVCQVYKDKRNLAMID